MSEQKASSKLPQWILDHIELYKRDPAKAHLWDASLGGAKGMLTTLLLTTRGRKSGNDVSIPLIYSPYGNAFVVIASKGGAPDHPSWYKNLLANPSCDLQVSTKAYQAKARTAKGEERAKLWKQMQALYPPYDDYQKRAQGREIPVVVLEPVATQ
jgi:deazaflavin-dependent oxidoreductase (nitroreductase family)